MFVLFVNVKTTKPYIHCLFCFCFKVWFQNKRARWRCRVKNTANMYPGMSPMSPTMSPVAHYGMQTPHSMFASHQFLPQAMQAGAGHFAAYPVSPGVAHLTPGPNLPLPGYQWRQHTSPEVTYHAAAQQSEDQQGHQSPPSQGRQVSLQSPLSQLEHRSQHQAMPMLQMMASPMFSSGQLPVAFPPHMFPYTFPHGGFTPYC
jgi:hypothetical protein